VKIKKSELKQLIKEEIENTMDEGFFGDMGDKMGFETSTTKRRAKNLDILVSWWKEAVDDARYYDQTQFDSLLDKTARQLKVIGLRPAKIAALLKAIGAGDGSTASDAWTQAVQDVTRRGGSGSDMITLLNNGLPEIVDAVGEEEANRLAAARAARIAAQDAEFERDYARRVAQADAKRVRRQKYDASQAAEREAGAREEEEEHRRKNKEYQHGEGGYGGFSGYSEGQIKKIVKETLKVLTPSKE